MKIINTKDANFKDEFNSILARAKSDIKGVSSIVMNIIDEIVEEGNEALKSIYAKIQYYEQAIKEETEIQIKKGNIEFQQWKP